MIFGVLTAMAAGVVELCLVECLAFIPIDQYQLTRRRNQRRNYINILKS